MSLGTGGHSNGAVAEYRHYVLSFQSLIHDPSWAQSQFDQNTCHGGEGRQHRDSGEPHSAREGFRDGFSEERATQLRQWWKE